MEQARTVAEGRERVAEGGIAAVDVPLPDGGAQAPVRELYEAEPPVPVPVLTATTQGRKTHEGFPDAGAAEVLSEGVPFAGVQAAVGRLGGARIRMKAG